MILTTEKLLELQKYDSDFKDWVKASIDYYDINLIAELSDEEFDELTENLQNKYSFVNDDSNTNENAKLIYLVVTKGIALTDGAIRIEHTNTEQVSLKKIKDIGSKTIMEVKKFLSNGTYEQNKTPLVIGPKLDGISLKIKFETSNQKLLIQTRGGQDITNELKSNLDIISLINKHSSNKLKTNILHGELVIDKKTFIEKYSDEYENPRNCIVGVLKTNPMDLRFVVCTDGLQPENINFNIWNELPPGLNLEQYFKNNYKNDFFPFQVDGMVIGH